MRFSARSRAGSTLTAVLVALVASTLFAHQAAEPRPGDAQTAILVCKLVEQYHIGHAKINDDVSDKLFERFLNMLDPRKLYFTQADVDAISKNRKKLDDQLKEGDVNFAYETFSLYLTRLLERKKLADVLIDVKHDFSVDEDMIVDAEKLPWAPNDAEIRERWRKQIKFDLLQLKLEDTAATEAHERLKKRYHLNVEAAAQTDDGEKLEMYLSALTHCLDPHSSYMSPQTREEFKISMELRLEGIGAALQQEDGYTVVKKIVPGGAAEKDGRLKVGDKIIGVDKGDGEMMNVVEMKLNKVVRMIRGHKDTKVRLKVKTADVIDLKDPTKNKKGETVVFELTRQQVELTSQEVKGEIIKTADRLKDGHATIGVINIPSFYRDFQGASNGDDQFKSTARDVQKVLADFRSKGGVDLVVVDLRNNGGGALSEAIEVSGLFLESGPVVQVKEPGGEKETHQDANPSIAYSKPLVVVTNRLSASASEIFAGVIKDYKRGLIVGDVSTHGKGTVQNVMNVAQGGLAGFFKPEDRGALKLTISQFYRVNGDSTQNDGVRSDVVLPSLLDHMELGESSLDNALKFDRIPPAEYSAWDGHVSPQLISSLKQRSETRIATDNEFKKLNKDIETYVQRKARKTISLNLESRKKERLQDKIEEKKAEELVADEQNDGPVFPVSFYNNELLRIGLDYLQLMQGTKTAGTSAR